MYFRSLIFFMWFCKFVALSACLAMAIGCVIIIPREFFTPALDGGLLVVY